MQSSGGQSVQQGNGRRVAGFFRLQRLFSLRLATQLRHLIGERKKKGIEAAGGSTKAASVFTRAAPTPRTPHPHPSPHPTFTHTHGPLSAALTLSLYFSLFLLGLLNSPLLLLSSKKKNLSHSFFYKRKFGPFPEFILSKLSPSHCLNFTASGVNPPMPPALLPSTSPHLPTPCPPPSPNNSASWQEEGECCCCCCC